MQAYQAGNSEAFSELFARYKDRIYRFFYLKYLSEAISSDLFQEAFLRLHRGRESYQKEKKFSSWFFSIAANLHKDELRRRARRPGDVYWSETGDDPESFQIVDNVANPENIILKKDLQVFLKKALNNIPEDQREVILLHKFEGLTFTEIAELLGQKKEAVKSKAFRGYKTLRKILEEQRGEVTSEM